MNDNQDKVRVHVSDGIQEYDNPLPKWWVGLFWVCIVIAGVYMAYYHILGGASLREEFNVAEAARASNTKQNSPEGSSAKYIALLNDQGTVVAGKEVFATNCAPCHGNHGEGVVGPNLTDKAWIHGGSPAAIFKTVAEGVPEKGMISWLPIIGEDKVGQVMTYVVSLKGTTPANPKAPEGTVED